MTGGVFKGMSIEQAALGGAARSGAGAGGLPFVQISDSHIGFNKDANPDVTATLRVLAGLCATKSFRDVVTILPTSSDV